MAAGDESKLTSIEFEISTCASLDAPGAPTAGNPRRPLAVLSVLVIVIGALAALLWANSRESEPADDIADTEAEDRGRAENDEVAADETAIEPEPTAGSNDVVATPFGRDFDQVVLIGDELFALDESEAILPEIYRSPDGLEWTSVDVQMDRVSGSQVWFELDDIGGELVLIGELSGENTWHSSLDGEVWTELNLGREGQLSFFPVSSSGEVIAGLPTSGGNGRGPSFGVRACW